MWNTKSRVTKRGLAALEQAAINNGHEPLSGEYIEAIMPDGRVLAVVMTDYDVAKVKRENRTWSCTRQRSWP